MKSKIFVALTFPSIMAFSALIVDNNRSAIQLPQADTTKWPASFEFGRQATPAEIAAWDIDVRPDGKGLPPGKGDAKTGSTIYTLKCAVCHGAGGRQAPDEKLLGAALVGDTLATSRPKTIGNYWPYATTLFDYIRRAMPYNQPGSLTDNEVYSLTAYLLNANKIIKNNTVINAQTLPKVVMPAKKLFIMDNREGGPEVK
ncbi:c-type cytochrome [Mucilaginibacter auburnensis]|uniref:Cytochrome c n=1 Tax=Mucilaginibacter auburnensis TaxID=1457233 RepID=A0A2H9VV14_9SPHI|nr:cytochrome c [Mucilaginibacter auburnensis]PJJ84665.1 cytochrome c [Mucilaginibacter auburnensis]